MRSFGMCVIILLLNIFYAYSQNSTTASTDYKSYTAPTVNLTSCVHEVAVLEITNLKSGGLIYIRTRTGIHKLAESFDTNGEVYTLQCAFADCGIEWFNKFTFVSQRHSMIQTSHDLHQTFICLADLVSIMPGGGSTSDEIVEDVLQHRYRATAAMRFLNSAGTELTSGTFIKLGAQMELYINITNNIDDMFDLSVKSCSALLLPLIEDRCPADDDLFGQFTKLSVGVLFNNFSMFRPTSTQAGAMDVLFSCTLEICLNPCSTYHCNGTEAVPISQNDTVRRKRQAGSRSLKLGTIFRVDYDEPAIEEPHRCTGTTPVAVITSLAMVFSASLVLMLYYFTEWRRECHSKNESTKTKQENQKEHIAVPQELANSEVIACPSKLLLDINRKICEDGDAKVIELSPTHKLKSCLKSNPQNFSKSVDTENINVEGVYRKRIRSYSSESYSSDIIHEQTNPYNITSSLALASNQVTTKHMNDSVQVNRVATVHQSTHFKPNGLFVDKSRPSVKQYPPTITNRSMKAECLGKLNHIASHIPQESVNVNNGVSVHPNAANASVNDEHFGQTHINTPTQTSRSIVVGDRRVSVEHVTPGSSSIDCKNATSSDCPTKCDKLVNVDYKDPDDQNIPIIRAGGVKDVDKKSLSSRYATTRSNNERVAPINQKCPILCDDPLYVHETNLIPLNCPGKQVIDDCGTAYRNPPIKSHKPDNSDCGSVTTLSNSSIEKGLVKPNCFVSEIKAYPHITSLKHDKDQPKHPVDKVVFTNGNKRVDKTSNTGGVSNNNPRHTLLKRSMSQAIAREILTLRERSSSSPQEVPNSSHTTTTP